MPNFPTYPAQTFRSMTQALPVAPNAPGGGFYDPAAPANVPRPTNPRLPLALPPSAAALGMLRGLQAPAGTPGLTPDQQAAQFDQLHPFAPSGSFTPTGAPAPDAGPGASFQVQNENANAGLTVPGTFGRQNADANAPVLPARYVDPASGPGLRPNPTYPNVPQPSYNGVNGVGTPMAGQPRRSSMVAYQGWPTVNAPGAPFDLTQQPQPGAAPVLPASFAGPGGPSAETLAMGRLFPSAGPAGPLPPGVDPNFASLAGSAASLQAGQAEVGANRTLQQLQRAGALPAPGDSPEVSAGKFGYLNSRLQTSLNGGTPRAPGSPIYNGPPDATAAGGGVTAGDAAAAYRRYQMTAGRPGALGYETVNIPGVGTLVKDRATGQPLSQKDFAKTTDPKEKALSDQELQQVTALQQSKRDLDSIESAYNELHDPNYGGPVGGRLDALLPGNPKVQRLQNLVTAATPNLARGVFRERGVLTDADVQRYQKLVPSVNDTAAQRTQKLADLRSRLEASTNDTLATLEASGRDVTDLRTHIMGPNAAAPGGNSAPNNASLAAGSITPDQARAEIARRRASKK